jgi:DNA-binding NarL/FixJ family response regulator
MAVFRLLLIDDHALFREGLCLVLRRHFPEASIVEAISVTQAINLLKDAPDVILLDILLQGLDGIEGVAIFRQRWPQVPVIMLSSMAAPETIAEALERGAFAFVSKADSSGAIVQTVERALVTTEPGIARDSAISCAGENRLIRLTARQSEVLQLLCDGLPNKVIARRMSLSEFTVRGHVQAIFGLLGVTSRTQAIVSARKHGLVA